MKCIGLSVISILVVAIDSLVLTWLALSPQWALTLKVNVDSGLSPDSLVMTAVVVEPFTTFSPWKTALSFMSVHT